MAGVADQLAMDSWAFWIGWSILYSHHKMHGLLTLGAGMQLLVEQRLQSDLKVSDGRSWVFRFTKTKKRREQTCRQLTIDRSIRLLWVTVSGKKESVVRILESGQETCRRQHHLACTLAEMGAWNSGILTMDYFKVLHNQSTRNSSFKATSFERYPLAFSLKHDCR